MTKKLINIINEALIRRIIGISTVLLALSAVLIVAFDMTVNSNTANLNYLVAFTVLFLLQIKFTSTEKFTTKELKSLEKLYNKKSRIVVIALQNTKDFKLFPEYYSIVEQEIIELENKYNLYVELDQK